MIFEGPGGISIYLLCLGTSCSVGYIRLVLQLTSPVANHQIDPQNDRMIL